MSDPYIIEDKASETSRSSSLATTAAKSPREATAVLTLRRSVREKKRRVVIGPYNWAKHIDTSDETLRDELMIDWIRLQSMKSYLSDELSRYRYDTSISDFETIFTNEIDKSLKKKGRVLRGVGLRLSASWNPVWRHICLQDKNANCDTIDEFVGIMTDMIERQICLQMKEFTNEG
jgi:hypothetical protein